MHPPSGRSSAAADRYGAAAHLSQGLVRDFVEKTLGGSVSPLMAYLVHTRRVSEEELGELEELVAQLKADRAGEEGAS